MPQADNCHKPIYRYWKRVAKEEFTRGQIAQTAEDNRDLCSPVWNAMQDELLRRDANDRKRMLRQEMKDIHRGQNPYGLQRHKPEKHISK